jgi:hypothetical protein
MADDPGAKRTLPPPPHPRGFRAIDDGPVHLAPPIDVRPVASGRQARDSVPWLGPPPDESSATDSGPETTVGVVPFALPVPVEERVSARPPATPVLAPVANGDDERAPLSWQEPGPITISFDSRSGPAASSGARSIGAPASSPPPSPPPVGATLPQAARPATLPSPQVPSPSPPNAVAPVAASLDEAASERAAAVTEAERQVRASLVAELRAIGAVDERPDRSTDKGVALRATLARARALRVRISAHDAWPSTETNPAAELRDATSIPHEFGALALDFTIDVASLVIIADGAPTGFSEASAERLPPFEALVRSLRPRAPGLTRTALRDRSASAIARLTVLGYAAALESVARAARTLPAESRWLALALAVKSALAPEINGHRLGALGDLERALALPTGTLAELLGAARSRTDEWF